MRRSGNSFLVNKENPLFYADPSGHWVSVEQSIRLKHYLPRAIHNPITLYYEKPFDEAYDSALTHLGALNELYGHGFSARYMIEPKGAEEDNELPRSGAGICNLFR